MCVWSRTWEYDQYGNGAVHVPQNDPIQPAPLLTPQSLASDFDAANNRIIKAGFGYDATGNVQLANGVSYTYDAENRLAQSQTTIMSEPRTVVYAYDGDGRRVRKTVDGTVITTYVYDASGELAAEYGPADASASTQYLTADHLGSTRLVTDGSGAVISRHDYLPFGEEIGVGVGGRSGIACGTAPNQYPCYAAADNITQRFTGKERDTDIPGNTLDYFGARYFSSNMGRFASADEPLLDQHPGDSQSWNLYHYGRDNPLRYVDLDGQAHWDASGYWVGDRNGELQELDGVGVCWNEKTQQWDNAPERPSPLLLAVAIGAQRAEVPAKAAFMATGAVTVLAMAPAAAPAVASASQAAVVPVTTGATAVYVFVENGVIRYIGVTTDFVARAEVHFRSLGMTIEAIPGLENLSREDARAVEQVLIEMHGLARNFGALYNRINSIAQSNRMYNWAMARGQYLLQKVGF